MKLVRWAAAGASAYVIYKYAIGRKAKGEAVFSSPETDLSPDVVETAPKSSSKKSA